MYYITDQVGNNLTNNPMDIIGTKENFKRLGLFDGDVSMPFIDKALDDTIIGFQRDNGLKVDRKMNPGGPTEQMVARRLKDTPPIPRRKPDVPKPQKEPSCSSLYVRWKNGILNAEYAEKQIEIAKNRMPQKADKMNQTLDHLRDLAIQHGVELVFEAANPFSKIVKGYKILKNADRAWDMVEKGAGILTDFHAAWSEYQASLEEVNQVKEDILQAEKRYNDLKEIYKNREREYRACRKGVD